MPRGPILDYDSSHAPYILSSVLDKIIQLARRRFAVARISPNVKQANNWVREMLSEKGFCPARRRISHVSTIRLDLKPSLDQIVKDMEKRRREDVRRFERMKANWTFRNDNSIESLKAFYSLYSETMSDIGGFLKSFKELRIMHDSLMRYDSSHLLTVQYQSHLVAGAIVATIGDGAWPMYIATSKRDRAVSGAGVALYWEMFKWLKQRGCAEYDFQGIPNVADSNDPNYGIYLFKRGWGGEVVNLVGEYQYSPYPLLGRLLDWTISRQ